MIKHRIMSAATLLGGVVFTGHAVAQSPEVARRLDAKYDVVWPAADGLIRVNKGGYRIPDSRMKSNGKYGYADTLGQVVVPPAYDDAADFGNGHAVVGRKAGDGRMLYGLIDRSGRVVVPLEWERLGGVRDGGCVARTGTAAEREFSLADTLGYVRSLGYDYCSDFSNGLARVGVGAYVEKENVAGITLRDAYEFRGKFGYIAPDGRIVIPVQFDDARDFAQDGLAPVGIQGKYYVKWGFIDKSGRQVVPCNFYSAEEFLGDRAALDAKLQKLMNELEEDSAAKTGMTLNIAVNYGGRPEIVRAARQLAQQVAEGTLRPEDITEEMMSDHMYTAGQKDPDFILRPSGEKRLSNFMLWQAAYAELVEMDVLWPDFTRDDLDAAITEFNKRSRRFGGI